AGAGATKLAGALAFGGLKAARIELEQVSDLIVGFVGRGCGEPGGPDGGAADSGRGRDEFEQVEGDVFVAARGARQCRGLIHDASSEGDANRTRHSGGGACGAAAGSLPLVA